MPGAHKFTKNLEATSKFKFHNKDPQIVGATVPNVVTTATWRSGFVLSCSTLID